MGKPAYVNAALNDDEAQEATRRCVAELSAGWQKAHDARTAEIEGELMKAHAQAGAGEKLLLHLAAHDGALSDKLAQAEAQLAQRLLSLIDNTTIGLALAKTLKHTVACHEAASRRLQSNLQAAAVLRGQRKLAEIRPLRSVA